MSQLSIDAAALEGVAGRLDLRAPNVRAVHSVLVELSQHYDVDAREDVFERVVVSATGMGKTYIMAGLIEYLAQVRGVRHFALIAPGKTIRDKTENNFTVGHPSSLLGGMEVEPVVVTTENFATSSTRAAMEDDSRVKLYVLTVQSLIKPKQKANRKAHEFQEGLGGAFYEQLRAAEDLVVLADEHHCYYGKSFSDAVRSLEPMALVGMTATPHKDTPDEAIVFRYPLAAAIAEKYVKTPVIVARKDDRTDAGTKLLDGVTLLRAKQHTADAYSEETGAKHVRCIMLVVAQTIAEAEEYEEVLTSAAFDGGQWEGVVLTVNSSSSDEALQALEDVEREDSPYRVIISVGMLKEGWDVKSVYVIASMRASVSDILTEQTLGRGMRLPWGEYTGIEMLDTVEVLAHEQYKQLLAKADVLNQAFIDHTTRSRVVQAEDGSLVASRETEEVVGAGPGGSSLSGDAVAGTWPTGGTDGAQRATSGDSSVRVTDTETRAKEAEEGEKVMLQTIAPALEGDGVLVPRLEMVEVKSSFSLADITELLPFEKLGKSLAADPDREFERTRVSARVEVGEDGVPTTILERQRAEDRIESSTPLFPAESARDVLEVAVLSSPMVPARNPAKERRALQPILDALFEGLGGAADAVVGAHRGKVAARLVQLITAEARKYAKSPEMKSVTRLERIGVAARSHRREVSTDLRGTWDRKGAYSGWSKSVYPVEWFDSSPERDVANVLDGAEGISKWLRLHRNELPILWNDAGRRYNADFIAIEEDGTHWVLEVKSDREVGSEEVQAKREAARRWVNHVNADGQVEQKWAYVLVTESDIKQAKGAWVSLRSLGS